MIIVNILSRKIDEIIYDPYSLLYKLDEEDDCVTDKRDPNIPNIDVSLRRKLFLKSKQLAKLFIYIDNYHQNNGFYMEGYPSQVLINIIEKISNLFMYQIEPEIMDLCIKLQPRNKEEAELHEKRHLDRCEENIGNTSEYRYIKYEPNNPTLQSKTVDERDKIMLNYHPDYNNDYPENAIPRPEMPSIRSSLYSQVVFTHSTISYIHMNTVMPLLYKLKSLRRNFKQKIKYNIPHIQCLPDIIIEKILNEYL